jgi:hypothetical protein
LRRLLLLGSACVALCATDAWSQVTPSRPDDVARAFFAAAAAERWRDAAAFLDLRSFDIYRKDLVAHASDLNPGPQFTVEMLMKRDTAMPRAVAEYQIAQFKKYGRDSSSYISQEFAGVTTPGQLDSLSTIDAAAKMIEAHDIRYRMRRSAKFVLNECRDSVLKSLPQMSVSPQKVFGAVVQDSIAYVLHQMGEIRFAGKTGNSVPRRPSRASGDPVRDWFSFPPAVMELRKIGGRWRIAGGPGMLGDEGGFGWDCGPRK